jgi:hypothetical protein
MTKQKLGQYLTYGGYASGLIAVILSAHHLPVLISAGAAVALVFVGRQLEKV